MGAILGQSGLPTEGASPPAQELLGASKGLEIPLRAETGWSLLLDGQHALEKVI